MISRTAPVAPIVPYAWESYGQIVALVWVSSQFGSPLYEFAEHLYFEPVVSKLLFVSHELSL